MYTKRHMISKTNKMRTISHRPPGVAKRIESAAVRSYLRTIAGVSGTLLYRGPPLQSHLYNYLKVPVR